MNFDLNDLVSAPKGCNEPCLDCKKKAVLYSKHGSVYLCIACYERRLYIKKEREKNERRFNEASRHGDLTMAFKNAGFRRSDPTIEALNPEVWKFGRAWEAKENICLQGTPGTGKTFLARCVLRKFFVKRQWDVAEVSARRLLKTAERFDEGGGDFLRWCDTSLVLLDDIDKFEPTSRRLEAFWELFDRRESSASRTIVTGNVPIDRLAQYLQPRDMRNQTLVTATLDRLRPVKVLELSGESLRGRSVVGDR